MFRYGMDGCFAESGRRDGPSISAGNLLPFKFSIVLTHTAGSTLVLARSNRRFSPTLAIRIRCTWGLLAVAIGLSPVLAVPGNAQANVGVAALPAVSPVPQPSGRTQEESARPILYLEEVNGQPVVTGLYLDGRRVVVPVDNAATIPLWSPDGAWVAYSSADSATRAGVLAVVNLRGERHRLFVARDSVPALARWSPDGRLIAAFVVTRDQSTDPKTIPLVVLSVVDNAVRSRVSIPVAALAARVQPTVSWSPDGQRILVAVG